jgi:hypothetical protein
MNYVLIADTGLLGTNHGPPKQQHYQMSVAAGTLKIIPPPIHYVMAAA